MSAALPLPDSRVRSPGVGWPWAAIALRGINGAAASEGDDQFDVAGGAGTGVYEFNGGLSGDGENFSVLSQARNHSLESPRAAPCDDERPRAELPRDCRQSGGLALSEDNACRGGELERHATSPHHPERCSYTSGGARLRHHGGDGVSPDSVVRCFFVGGGGFGGAVHLDEDEAGRVIALL